MMEILGATCLSVTVAGASEGAHTRRTNRVPFNQLSSTLMMRCVGGELKQPDSSSGRILIAYCYRSTRHRSELDWMATVLAKR